MIEAHRMLLKMPIEYLNIVVHMATKSERLFLLIFHSIIETAEGLVY